MSTVSPEYTRVDDMDGDNERTPGKVFLVGAGPGDPELITLKALRCLRSADVVIYDRLICPDLLDEIPPSAFQIFVGKMPGKHTIPQAEINALLIAYARNGHTVVRLKGGDPFVFGRGGEEALALAAAGIPFEVVPGISSAFAVPAYAGIPVTQREMASAVTIVTGHAQSPTTPAAAGVDWKALAATKSTLVILMGVETLPEITRQLLAAGMDETTPAAVIQQGTLPQQHIVSGTLASIADRAARVQSPAVIVIGAVAALGEKLAWFQQESFDRSSSLAGADTH